MPVAGRGSHAFPGPGRRSLKAFNHSSTDLPKLNKSQPLCSLGEYPQISGIRAFGALRDFEFHLVPLFQGFKPFRLTTPSRVLQTSAKCKVSFRLIRRFLQNAPQLTLLLCPIVLQNKNDKIFRVVYGILFSSLRCGSPFINGLLSLKA